VGNWLDAWLLASQEGLCYTELVGVCHTKTPLQYKQHQKQCVHCGFIWVLTELLDTRTIRRGATLCQTKHQDTLCNSGMRDIKLCQCCIFLYCKCVWNHNTQCMDKEDVASVKYLQTNFSSVHTWWHHKWSNSACEGMVFRNIGHLHSEIHSAVWQKLCKENQIKETSVWSPNKSTTRARNSNKCYLENLPYEMFLLQTLQAADSFGRRHDEKGGLLWGLAHQSPFQMWCGHLCGTVNKQYAC